MKQAAMTCRDQALTHTALIGDNMSKKPNMVPSKGKMMVMMTCDAVLMAIWPAGSGSYPWTDKYRYSPQVPEMVGYQGLRAVGSDTVHTPRVSAS